MKYFFGNLKMNLLPDDTEKYCQTLMENCSTKNAVGVAVPYTSLFFANKILNGQNVILGAQNLYYEEKGSFTGEISAQMLKQSGCNFVIVGHSERRQKFGETNLFINKKIKALLKKGLKIIFCIGETQSERELGKTKKVISKQLSEGLEGLYENELQSIMIAYEPVWAIGTGVVPTTKQVCDVAIAIRKFLSLSYSQKSAEEMVILYGGSVKKDNVKAFISQQQIDGVLVGGASNDALEFASLTKVLD